MDCGSKPLVSFCLKSYNQKKYLKDALEGAFAQTYRPLEIVISDDASTDGSADLILARTREWNGGIDGVVEHDIERNCDVVRFTGGGGATAVVLLNKENLGNLGNWQRICEFARGVLFVKADGDDVSLPERTERVVAMWLKDGKKALIVAHRAYKMDCNGTVYGEMDNCGAGAVSAYSSTLYSKFGPIVIEDKNAYDDYVYAMRVKILGGDIHFFDARLVKYRMGVGVSSAFQHYRVTMAKTFQSVIAGHRQSEVDAAMYHVELPSVCRYEELIKLWNGSSFRERWDGCCRLKSLKSGPMRLRLLALLLLTGRFSDWILDSCRVIKLKFEIFRWRGMI